MNPSLTQHPSQSRYYSSNPYAQATSLGHHQRTTHDSLSPLRPHSPPSPTFGALPSTIPVASPNWIPFTFLLGKGGILDSAVVGSLHQPFFGIETETPTSGPAVTTISKLDGSIYARIKWKDHPEVEIPNLFSPQTASRWIAASKTTRTTRVMQIEDTQYQWERYKNSIYLYKLADARGRAELLGRFQRSAQSFVLNMTPNAIRAGLLEPSITALLFLTTPGALCLNGV